MDDSQRLRGIVETAMRSALGRQGLTPREVDIFVDWDHAGVILRRHRIGHEWVDGHAGDTYPVKRSLRNGGSDQRAAAATERFVELMLALRARNRQLELEHDDPAGVPAWSVLVETCALHLMRHAGWQDEDILRFYRPSEGRYTAGWSGYTVGRDLVGSDIDGYRLPRPALGLNAGVLTMERLAITGDSGSVTYIGGRTPKVEIATDPVPETLLTAMRGRPLHDAVGHPAYAGCGARITSATQKRLNDGIHQLQINLARDLIPMAPAPVGVDTTWLEAIRRG